MTPPTLAEANLAYSRAYSPPRLQPTRSVEDVAHGLHSLFRRQQAGDEQNGAPVAAHLPRQRFGLGAGARGVEGQGEIADQMLKCRQCCRTGTSREATFPESRDGLRIRQHDEYIPGQQAKMTLS